MAQRHYPYITPVGAVHVMHQHVLAVVPTRVIEANNHLLKNFNHLLMILAILGTSFLDTSFLGTQMSLALNVFSTPLQTLQSNDIKLRKIT